MSDKKQHEVSIKKLSQKQDVNFNWRTDERSEKEASSPVTRDSLSYLSAYKKSDTEKRWNSGKICAVTLQKKGKCL